MGKQFSVVGKKNLPLQFNLKIIKNKKLCVFHMMPNIVSYFIAVSLIEKKAHS